ncbi:tandem-95 repeat protein [Ramlibacter terrae]|uniref:Tandem-95 repeat protein n=1 Tax=Ramlibacter terrae TaxID=2732511 RepID=A0ABX6P1T8_9BURK|nr:tandem-95 repeat protein [Ramlibacter terrae]
MISPVVAPVADIAGNAVTVAEDASVTTDVRANDSFEGATPTITAVTNGAHGTVTIVDAAAGTILYTPDADFHGTDSYTYTITSGGVTETATVSVTVTPIDDAATFGGATTGSGNEDAGAITGVLTAADAADGMAAPAFTVTGNPVHGSATVNPATGAWRYTPAADFNGSDSFTVTVTDDDGNLSTQVISVTVNAVADIADNTATVDEDGSVTRNLLANDSFESAAATITAVSNGANGTVTIVDAELGTVRYTPNANFSGTDSYTYTVTSGGVTETATVTVTVSPLADPTVFGGATGGSGAEDGGAITGTLTVGDADGITAPAFTVVGNAAHGTATIDAATGARSYTPVADYNGADSFTVRVTDSTGATSTQVISLAVTSDADIANDTASVAEDSSVDTAVRGNDTFEGTPIVTAVTNGTHGTVTIVDATAGTVRYTPDADWHGTDTYTYTVTSGGVTETATVTVTVSPVNDPATFGGATSGSGTEDGAAITGTLTAADVDGMATPGFCRHRPRCARHGHHHGGGRRTYTPAADYNGADSFTVTVTDNAGNTTTQVISLSVTAVADIAGNTVTVAEDGSVTSSLFGNDTFEGTPAITAVTAGAHGTVTIVDAAAGTVLYTPDPDFHGTDSYTYTVTSGGVTETATVTVNVTPVDDAATFGGATSGAGNEDAGTITGTLTVADTADGMTAPAFSVSGNPAHGTATINAATGTGATRRRPTTTAPTASRSPSRTTTATRPRKSSASPSPLSPTSPATRSCWPKTAAPRRTCWRTTASKVRPRRSPP